MLLQAGIELGDGSGELAFGLFHVAKVRVDQRQSALSQGICGQRLAADLRIVDELRQILLGGCKLIDGVVHAPKLSIDRAQAS